MRVFTETLSDNGQVTLTAYLLDASKEMENCKSRPAVLVFPGGAYAFLSDREAEPIACSFLEQGYQAFVLRYTIGKDKSFSDSLRDAENALRRIRSMAEEWNVNPGQVAVCGFSAGGHLAAAVSTMGAERPNATILGYPCILSSISRILAFPVPSLDEKVTVDTPPAFIFHTADDNCVPLENSLRYADALSRSGVPFEMHIFPHGSHGLALATDVTSGGAEYMVNPAVAQWIPLCIRWLKDVFPCFACK